VDVDREVRLDGLAVEVDIIAGRSSAQIDYVGLILGIMAPEAIGEPVHQVLAENPGQLLTGPAAMKRVSAEKTNISLLDACFPKLLEDRFDREPADGPERRRRRVVEGDKDAAARADELADARESDRRGEGLADGALPGSQWG